MKTSLLLALAALLGGCASSPSTADTPPLFSTFGGKTYVVLPVPMSTLQTGDLVLYRVNGQYFGAKLGTARGEGVFRIEGDGLTLVTASNYVGKLAGQ